MRQNTNVHDVWQRNYYEHIIRNEQSFQTILEYIISIPAKWYDDKFFTKFNKTQKIESDVDKAVKALRKNKGN